ncbi:hypothetical protein [Motilibacter aurantiacus]|uniref:hypothetical protein n=1 Tax=Motilibacter aurantiacus TaxID=2714955 RepID=UPI00140C1447|nr:hypothetical protein [Motilibacter aurantiacus]NHC47590.1 hypothetical protein [Motilibacter aurantiacus]
MPEVSEPAVVDARVVVDEFQFVLQDGDGRVRVEAPEDNGLLSFEEEQFVCILCGAHAGEAQVVVERHFDEPTADLASWEDVAEFSVTTDQGLRLGSLFGEPVSVPLLEQARGELRVRVCARGRLPSRDAFGYDEDSGPLLESYAIQFWPAPAVPPRVLKGATDH